MNYLNKFADENKLPVMDQQQFETVTNDIGKEKFRDITLSLREVNTVEELEDFNG